MKAALQDSHHRTLRGLRFRSDDTNAPTAIFRSVLGEGSYPLAQRLLRSWIIEEIARSQPPTGLCTLPTSGPSRTPAASVLQYNLFFAPLQLLLKTSVLPSLRRLGRRPYMLRLPCRRPHGGSPPLHLPHTSNGSHPEAYVGDTPTRSFSSGAPPTVCQSAFTPERFWFLTLLTLLCK